MDRIPKKQESRTLSFRVPKTFYDEIATDAAYAGISLSEQAWSLIDAGTCCDLGNDKILLAHIKNMKEAIDKIVNLSDDKKWKKGVEDVFGLFHNLEKYLLNPKLKKKA